MGTTPAGQDRSASQISRELALGEVSDVLLNLEHTIARAKKARGVVTKKCDEPNIEFALNDLIKELDRTRKRLLQDTYYAGDAVRLL